MIKFPQLKSDKTINRVLIALAFLYLFGMGFVDGFGSKINICCNEPLGCMNIFTVCNEKIEPYYFQQFTNCQMIEDKNYCATVNGLCDKLQLQYKECAGDQPSKLYKYAPYFILMICLGIILNVLITTMRDKNANDNKKQE